MQGFFFRKEGKKADKKANRKQLQGDPCQLCGLCEQRGLRTPKLEPYGDGGEGVLIWGEAPGGEEDIQGIPFCGKVGKRFTPYFSRYGIDFEKDCITVNALDCRPPDNRKPTKKEIKYCHHRKQEVLDKYRPKVIFLLGDSAVNSFYGCDEDRKFSSSLPLASYRGKVIPDYKTQAWVCHSYHPSYIERGNQDLEHIFDLDFAVFASMVGKPRPSFADFERDIYILYDIENEVIPFLLGLKSRGEPFSFDYETSSYRYYEGIHELYLISVCYGNRTCVFRYCPEIRDLWIELMESDIPKIAQNIKHEILATHYVVGCKVRNMVYDTMIGAHVLDGSQGVTGLKNQAYINFGCYDYGLPSSVMEGGIKQKNRFSEIPFEEGAMYCGKDSIFTYRLAKKQKRLLKARGLEKAYTLFHEGALAFADMEKNGIRIDVPFARKMDADWEEQIEEYKETLFSCEEARKFERVVGRQLKYGKKLADGDLRQLLFDILGFKPVKETKTKTKTKTTYSVDEESLKTYVDKSELVDIELKLRKINKLKGTYLAQFLRYEVGGFIYPSFHLHFARSYRSSSSEPNFQNIPRRSEEGRAIRKIIIPREGHELWEADYSSMEVRILACQSKDAALIDYIVGGGDIHADWGKEVFLVREEDLSEEEFGKIRDSGKSDWVFRLFYGGFYKQAARDIKIPDHFYPTLSYRRRQEKWESHLRDCEDRFWEQFKGVREWQDRKIVEYKKQGYIDDGAWGFQRHGYIGRNKLYNFPIQGPAFHCLLWSIIELWKKDYDWRSLLCGQIHDSMFWDGKPEEFAEVRKTVDRIATEDIREANPWIIVPLKVDWKRGPDWLSMLGVE